MYGIIATWRMALEGISEAADMLKKSADAGLSGSDVENDNAAWGGAYDQRNVSENGEAVLQGQAKAEVCV